MLKNGKLPDSRPRSIIYRELPCGNNVRWYSNYKDVSYFFCDKCKGKLGKDEISKECQSLIDQQRTLDIIAGKTYYDNNGYICTNEL